MRIRAAIIGAALAALAAVVVHYPLTGSARLLLALFLALTACVCLAALLVQTQTSLTTVGELLVGTGVFVGAFLGVPFRRCGWPPATYYTARETGCTTPRHANPRGGVVFTGLRRF